MVQTILFYAGLLILGGVIGYASVMLAQSSAISRGERGRIRSGKPTKGEMIRAKLELMLAIAKSEHVFVVTDNVNATITCDPNFLKFAQHCLDAATPPEAEIKEMLKANFGIDDETADRVVDDSKWKINR